jgi:hypothetical protein
MSLGILLLIPQMFITEQPPTHRFMRALRSIQFPYLILPRLAPHCLLGYTYSSLSDMKFLLNV